MQSGNLHQVQPRTRNIGFWFSVCLLLALSGVFARAEHSVAAPKLEKPKPSNFEALSETTEKVANEYVEHYFKREFDSMAKLAAEEVTVDDPTARTIWGGQPQVGRKQIYGKMNELFSTFTHLAFRTTRKFFSGEHAIIEGELDWTFKAGPEGKEIAIVGLPLVIVVQVSDGKVISHRDFADYRVFMKQYRAQTAVQGKS
nr:nuclear transport factor 2 family protein [uncultured Undibacterium sp.]